MARWALTVRRVRFLAASCLGCQSRSQSYAPWCWTPARCLWERIPSGSGFGAVRGRGLQSRIGSGSYLSDTLAVLATVQDGPGNATGVLALEEEGLGFAVLESEDLGVATDVELALQQSQCQHFVPLPNVFFPSESSSLPLRLR